MQSNRTLSLILAFSLFLSPFTSLSYAEKTLPPDVADVLSIMRDSRMVRDLKSAPMTQQAGFTQTLRDNVYLPAYKQVQEHLWAQKDFENKRVVVQEFRTPNANPNSVNTDNDIRVLVEVEPGHWREVPTKKWADKYYEAFAKQSGFEPDPNFKPEKMKPNLTQQQIQAESMLQQYRKHAQKYRQLATDQYHAEASRDYTDQKLKTQDLPDAATRQPGQAKAKIIQSSTIRQARDAQGQLRYHPDGQPMFESESHISAVKKGQANPDGTFRPLSERAVLRDAEGLSYMYFEKGDEQLRKAQDLEKKLQETRNLSRSERLELQDQITMHKAEAAAQIKKGATSLTELRGAYERQGFNVGKTSPSFDEASRILIAADGSHQTNVSRLEADLKRQGFESLSDYNAKLRGQVESLKLAQPLLESPAASPSLPKAPNQQLVRAGKAADAVSKFLAIKETTKQVKKGEHLFLNLDQDDAALEQVGKIAGANVLDLMGFTAAFQSGLSADKLEKERILKAIREGKTVSPLLSFVRSSSQGISEALWNMATASFVPPIDLAKEVVGYTMAASNERRAVAMAEEQQRQARNARWEQLEKPYLPPVTATPAGLGNRVWGFLNQVNGEPLHGNVKAGQMVAFSVKPDGDWNDAVRVEWLVEGQLYQAKLGSEANAASVRFSTDDLSGSNFVAVRLIDVNSGKILAHKGETLNVEAAKIKVATTTPKNTPINTANTPQKTSSSLAIPSKQASPALPQDQTASPQAVASVSSGTNANPPSQSTGGQDALKIAIKLQKSALETNRDQQNQLRMTLMTELQKIRNTCLNVLNTEADQLKKEKALELQTKAAMEARGYVTDAEAAAFNQQAAGYAARANASWNRQQEYKKFMALGQSGKVGEALLMGANLPCAVGSGYNHDTASRTFMRLNELERQIAQQEADLKKLTAQIKKSPVKTAASENAAKIYHVSTWTKTIVRRFQTQPGGERNKPFTICGLTLYAEDDFTAEGLNKGLYQEAVSKGANYNIYDPFDLVTSCAPHRF